jgi:hypothetical protein
MEIKMDRATEQKTTEMPEKLLSWLIDSRLGFLSKLTEGKPHGFFSAHLPVLATWSDEASYPVNMAVKGIGLLPRKDKLKHYTDIFEASIAASRSMPWDESLPERIEAIRMLYGNPDELDPTLIGGLEIFEGKTLENMKSNPHASLLYMGMSHGAREMKYISFQVNGTVELLDKESPYYKYLLASRKLFEFERFHLYQPDYPFGYIIHVEDAMDKSPFTKSNGHSHRMMRDKG